MSAPSDGSVICRESAVQGERAVRLQFLVDGGLLSIEEVARRWRTDGGFGVTFGAALGGVPFDAFLWETPPFTAGHLSRPFECVLIDSPALARFHPDVDAFSSHFDAGAQVVDFPNLGGDAHLVAPCPVGDGSAYTHLAAFVRGAPPVQVRAFWCRVGEVLFERVGPQPTWLSTCGLGIGWLHARFDASPKYYRHRPFRSMD